jgi:hypothetical protein
MRKPNGKHPDPASADFDVAVAECKEIIARIEARNEATGQDYDRIGEWADKLETKYGDETLAKFARAIGKSPSCVKRYRDVFRAFPGISAPERQSSSYSARKELATHPDRENIIRKNPNITKQEARCEVSRHRGIAEAKAQETKEEAEAAEALRETKKWFGDLVILANKIRGVAQITHQCTTDEQWCRLLDNVERQQLADIEGTGNTLIFLAELLEWLLNKHVSEDFADHLAKWMQQRERERQRRVVYSELKGRKHNAKRRATTPRAQEATAAHAAA